MAAKKKATTVDGTTLPAGWQANFISDAEGYLCFSDDKTLKVHDLADLAAALAEAE